ncbi:MAG: ATP-binding protein [Chloroflexi bacterium]|nr:ATP-binding protein [Chloroflexota bacterium]
MLARIRVVVAWLRTLPIGLRLFAGFLAIITLSGLTGALAVQRFSTLTAATTELNTHDLPEVITLGQLRTLLFEERDLDRNVVRGDEPQSAGDLTTLTSTLEKIAHYRATLIAFEPPDKQHPVVTDTPLVQQLIDALARSSVVTQQIQALVQSGRIVEARALEQRQQEPLLDTALAVTAKLRTLEQTEAATVAGQVQESSSAATRLVLALTLFSMPLALVLALLITRSLTSPLAALLSATESLAAGKLDVSPQISAGDEIGRLATAFETMRCNLRTTIASLAFQRRQVQAIIDASMDGVVLIGQQRTIVQFNPGAERLSGWRATDAVGRYCWEVFGCRGATPEEADEHERCCPLFLAEEAGHRPATATIHALLRQGERRWFAVSCAPLRQDDAVELRLVASIHDVSQLKVAEQLKSDFVAMVSHELRAPLTTVAGSVEMLGLCDPASDPEAFQEVLTILNQQTRRLRNVIEEVLQLTRVEAGHLQVHLQPLALVPFLGTLLEDVRLEWSDDPRTLQLHPLPECVEIWADPHLLEIVIRNLLDNARKYTPADSSIEVAMEKGADLDRLQVRIIDHGPGIPEPLLEHIFERFSRGLQSPTQWTRGYGLGLYIAREIITAHQGEIWAENHGDGACFVLSLWAAKDELNHLGV